MFTKAENRLLEINNEDIAQQFNDEPAEMSNTVRAQIYI